MDLDWHCIAHGGGLDSSKIWRWYHLQKYLGYVTHLDTEGTMEHHDIAGVPSASQSWDSACTLQPRVSKPNLVFVSSEFLLSTRDFCEVYCCNDLSMQYFHYIHFQSMMLSYQHICGSNIPCLFSRLKHNFNCPVGSCVRLVNWHIQNHLDESSRHVFQGSLDQSSNHAPNVMQQSFTSQSPTTQQDASATFHRSHNFQPTQACCNGTTRPGQSEQIERISIHLDEGATKLSKSNI